MSYFMGNGMDIFGGASIQFGRDRSWCRRANRMDFSMNPFYDGGAGPKRNRRYARKGIWPASKMAGGDPSVQGYALLGMDAQGFGRWGEFNIDGKGGSATKYVVGQIKDVNGVAVTGVLVRLFLTGNSALVSNGYSDSSGYYMLPTPYTGNTHYVVAVSSTVSGVTVDTLIPTNADGT